MKKEISPKEKTDKKGRRFELGLFIGLTIGILSCIGILIWHSFTEEKQFKEEYNEENKEAKELMDQLATYDILSYFYYELGKEEITNQDLLYFAMEEIGLKETITLTDIESVISKYFDYKVKPENIACRKNFHENTEYLYIYDAKKQEFIFNEEHGGHGAGHTKPYHIYNRFVSLKEVDENEYELVVYRAYSSLAEDTGIGQTAYYASYQDAEASKNALFNVEYDYDNDFKLKTDIDAELKKIEEKKLSKEKFTFIKKENQYVLTKYEVQ